MVERVGCDEGQGKGNSGDALMVCGDRCAGAGQAKATLARCRKGLREFIGHARSFCCCYA